MLRLGVDTGGTFTDFVLCQADGCLRIHKVLSTPEAPELAILQGIAELGLALPGLQLIHGSTVATNAALEGKGVKTAYVTNRGFADVLSIGRQQRQSLYELQPEALLPPVPSDLCLEIAGRVDHRGQALEPMSEASLSALLVQLRQLQPDAVAVNLLFSYLNSEMEDRIAAVLPENLFVSLSSKVLPEVREYERGMATWLNAWVGPLVAGYLGRLRGGLQQARISVMQSSGDTVSAEQAAGNAVRMLLSGPAGGLIAARHMGGLTDQGRMLTFDMGGTSTDVALIEGEPRLTTEGMIGRYPVAVPMVDMHTIGAGGGSIAWIDSGGLLQVGPQSAGAAPGPACYGAGGRAATVTDANLLLGRLQSDAFLGGEMVLDIAAARSSIEPLAAQLRQSPLQTADDIVAIANEHMAQALRAISIKRGADPREHTLVSFGGAGGLHVCALADLLEMPDAMVPVHGGVFSALGMLIARPGRQLSRTHIGLLERFVTDELQGIFSELREQGIEALAEDGVSAAECAAESSVDLRYLGQSYTLNLPWKGAGQTAYDFHEKHAVRYGHRLDLPVELVNLRESVRGPAPMMRLPVANKAPTGAPFGYCRVAGTEKTAARYWRDSLVAGQCIQGPALVCEQVATTWVPPAWQLVVDEVGNLHLQRC